MIKEAYCSFEVSKLLKEKGFDEKCSRWYVANEPQEGIVEKGFGENQFYINAPTHQMAMAWLREKYDLHIIVYPYNANGEKKWCCQVYKTFNLLGYGKYVNETLDSYEQAVESALKYALENLI